MLIYNLQKVSRVSAVFVRVGLLILLLRTYQSHAACDNDNDDAASIPTDLSDTTSPVTDAPTTSATTTSIPNDDPVCRGSPLIIPSEVTSRGSSKLIIAHRGATAHLPEHSLAGYRLAYELGADYAEPDLVATKDGHLVAIHSMDLNTTTNVQEVFPDRQEFSEFMNRTGYWTYSFTLEELKRLRIHQGLPKERSTTFDGLFTIPSLTEIMELLRDWNKNIAAKERAIGNNAIKRRVGIYAELKDTVWLKEDTGIDLVTLFFQHQENNPDLWDEAIGQNSCQAPRKFDYLPPPLVLQSFDGDALQSVKDQWNTHSVSSKIILPPMVLLVSYDKCLDDGFWYKVDESWRELISGIGPDKRCCNSLDFMDHTVMLGLAVHPWTVRPELEYHEDFPAGIVDELEDLFCKKRVHGVFSESVSEAVRVASMDCQTCSDNSKTTTTTTTTTSSNTHSNSQGTCQLGPTLGFSIALLSSVITACVVLMFCNNSTNKRNDYTSQVPTADGHDDDDGDETGII